MKTGQGHEADPTLFFCLPVCGFPGPGETGYVDSSTHVHSAAYIGEKVPGRFLAGPPPTLLASELPDTSLPGHVHHQL